MRTKIKKIVHVEDESKIINSEMNVYGWVKTLRIQKSFAFIEVNDGSSLKNLQVVFDNNSQDFQKILDGEVTTGTSIGITGTIVQSPGKNQKVEMHGKTLQIFGKCDNTFPLQKKRHSFEYLREIAHLRPRTNTQGAVIRVRNALAYATHKFFQEKDFFYINTPIITGADCEGGGELFQVTTIPEKDLSTGKKIDWSMDFFKKKAFLTVSGQLNAEVFACAMSDVYTFGPTFRAENSHTQRHLSEFWMMEPEMAFCDLKGDIKYAEEYLKYVIDYTLKTCPDDMEFFDKFIDKGLLNRLQDLVKTPFEVVTYTDAIKILEKSKKDFKYPYTWGSNLQAEHERYLCEDYFKKPTVVIDYPKEIKAFYMRDNDDNKTVAAMDILVPKIGELVGGSQREERLDVLEKKLKEFNLDKSEYWWYLELRKFGSVPHSGFGVGFERLVQFVTGMENIRDVIPFPRVPANVDF
jgi:asparaginyl-tRNA synthetase